jgi:hypothetical protein
MAPWKLQEQLRREADADLCRAAVALVTTRREARTKFGDDAASLWFDDEGLQMASADAVATHRAARFPAGEPVADLACGIGGDARALARRGPLLAADLDGARLWMARRNVEHVGASTAGLFVRADARRPVLGDAHLFLDPARRHAGGRRVRRGDDYLPPLQEALALGPQKRCRAVKVSPALDTQEIPTSVDEIEYVSWKGQCREAVLWTGVPGAVRRRATVIGGDELSWPGDEPPHGTVAPVRDYLFDPDPAVVRSHLVGVLAQRLDATLVTEQVAYLSADRPRATPLARCFEVLDAQPWQSKRLRQRLDAESWRPTEVLRRHFPLEPPALMRQLKGAGNSGERPVSLLCTRVDGKPVVFVCEPA